MAILRMVKRWTTAHATWFIVMIVASLILASCNGAATPQATTTPIYIVVTSTPAPATNTLAAPTTAPTNTPIAPAITATPQASQPTATLAVQPSATLATPQGAGILFGPFHLPVDDFGPPYTGAFEGLDPSSAIATLNAARAAGMHLVINLAGSRRNFQNTDLSFSPDQFKQDLEAFKDIDFGPYVADGTVVGHMMFDEPQDPNNWNGFPVPFSDIETAAEYSKQLWPTLPVGVGGPPSFLVQGSDIWKALDFGFAQYTTQRGDVKTWVQNEVNSAKQAHIGVMLGINILGGNNRNNVTAAQLQQWGQVLASDPAICGILMWKYDPTYLQDPSIVQALSDVSQTVKAHTNTPCKP